MFESNAHILTKHATTIATPPQKQQVYARMRAAGVAPTAGVFGRLFRAARNYAQRVRAEAGRRAAALPAGDSARRRAAARERRARLAGAHARLLEWQADMVAAGLRHDAVTLRHLLSALERANAAADCIRLAELHEQRRPGDLHAHREALRAAGRVRTPAAAGHAERLAAALEAGGRLAREERLVLLGSQCWLAGDAGAARAALEAARRAGEPLDPAAGQGLLHLFCAARAWGDALAVLDDLEAAVAPPRGGGGGASGGSSSSSSGNGGQLAGSEQAEGANGSGADQQQQQQQQQWRFRRYPPPALAPAVVAHRRQHHQHGHHSHHGHHHHQQQPHHHRHSRFGLRSDALWHVVLRQLVAAAAPDAVVTAFAARMTPDQRRRFARMYPLRRVRSGGDGSADGGESGGSGAAAVVAGEPVWSVLPPPEHGAGRRAAQAARAATRAAAYGGGGGEDGDGGDDAEGAAADVAAVAARGSLFA